MARRNIEGEIVMVQSLKSGIKHCVGRVMVYIPEDSPYRPMADASGYILRARLVMAEHLGRCLTTEETVHHEDEDRANDDYANLKLFPSNAAHISYHRRKEIELKGRRPTNALGQFVKGGYGYANLRA
jgi:hypothetical protein